MLAEIAGQDIADGVKVGAAVVGHHALGIARGARGIAQRNGVPLVVRQSLRRNPHLPAPARPHIRSRRSVGRRRMPHRRRRSRTGFSAPSSTSAPARYHAAENSGSTRMILAAAMVELKRDRGGIEPDVERVEHRTLPSATAKMHLVHRRECSAASPRPYRCFRCRGWRDTRQSAGSAHKFATR